MSPPLILARVPTSSTGVFPDMFLSSRGPKHGRSNPNSEVSPSISHDTISKNRSTSRMGNHFSNHMDNPKVDFPSISRGRTCTLTKPIFHLSHHSNKINNVTTPFGYLFFFSESSCIYTNTKNHSSHSHLCCACLIK